MEKGLLWLPLLAVFIWLTWAGWNDYQKVEAYRIWAQQFQRAKYDLYAVMGLKGDELVIGKPTRRGPVELQNLLLGQVEMLHLIVDDRVIEDDRGIVEQLPSKGRNIALRFILVNQEMLQVPFTELAIAVEWRDYLQKILQKLASPVISQGLG